MKLVSKILEWWLHVMCLLRLKTHTILGVNAYVISSLWM